MRINVKTKKCDIFRKYHDYSECDVILNPLFLFNVDLRNYLSVIKTHFMIGERVIIMN